jgi:signal transduction histidine kinase
MTPCDLNQAIADTLVVAHHEYRGSAEIETAFGELPLVSCHAASLSQVLLNVLMNALHAIAENGRDGRGRIVIRTHLDRTRVVISIEDNGAGIPEAIRHRVFDPFFTTKEVGKGSGQGLAVCRSVVVDQHGGELDFETSAGRGTTFFIRLPVRMHGGEASRDGTGQRSARPAEV